MIAATQITAITLAITIAAGSAMAGPVINAADQPSRAGYSSSTQQTAPVESTPESEESYSDGWKHGDTSDFDGETWYFHQGMGPNGEGAFVSYAEWCAWGQYPQAHVKMDEHGFYQTDGSFLKEDDRAVFFEDGSPLHWCMQEQTFITDLSWEPGGYHDRIHPGWRKLIT